MRLDDDDLRRLAQLRDPDGVLSVYVDADPALQAADRPRWAVTVNNELGALEQRVRQEGPRRRWMLFRKRLDEHAAEIGALLDPAQPGRARALFLPLSRGAPVRLALNTPLVDRIVLEERAYVRPLVAALEDGRPAGIVTVSKAGVGVHETRWGETYELLRVEFEEATAAWREFKGPAGANPAYAQQTAPQHDRFARRLDERRTRFLADCGERVASMAAAQKWDAVVIAGDPRLTRPLVEAGASTATLVEDDRALEGLPADDLAAALAPVIAEARERTRAVLAERAVGAALAGGAGSLGLDDTLAALGAGRVEHLLLLGAAGREPEAPSNGSPPRQANLDERMIELALDTGARITFVHPDAAPAFSEADAVAALLRW